MRRYLPVTDDVLDESLGLVYLLQVSSLQWGECFLEAAYNAAIQAPQNDEDLARHALLDVARSYNSVFHSYFDLTKNETIDLAQADDATKAEAVLIRGKTTAIGHIAYDVGFQTAAIFRETGKWDYTTRPETMSAIILDVVSRVDNQIENLSNSDLEKISSFLEQEWSTILASGPAMGAFILASTEGNDADVAQVICPSLR